MRTRVNRRQLQESRRRVAMMAVHVICVATAAAFTLPSYAVRGPAEAVRVAPPLAVVPSSLSNRAGIALEQEREQRPLVNTDFVPRVGWRGTVFPAVVSPLIASAAASTAALIAHELYGFDGIDSTPHVIGGVLVSFLAVFRTQLAYGRYWEARGHVGSLMAGIVDVASMASVQFSAERTAANDAARRELARLLRLYFGETVLFLRLSSRATRGASNYWLPEEAARAAGPPIDAAAVIRSNGDASDEEAAALRAAERPPVLVLQWIRQHIYRVGVQDKLIAGRDEAERTRAVSLGIDRLLSGLQPSFNGAAKIATTPVPQPYTQMSRWLIFWFVYTVPLVLIESFGTLDASGNIISYSFVPASMLLAFGYCERELGTSRPHSAMLWPVCSFPALPCLVTDGLDYCANELQNPFISEFGDVQLDGRFLLAVCTDVDMLLLPPEGASDGVK